MFRITYVVVLLVAQSGSAPLGALEQAQTAPDLSISEQTNDLVVTSKKTSDLVVTNETVPVSEKTHRKVKDHLMIPSFEEDNTANESEIKTSVSVATNQSKTTLSQSRPANFKELLAQARKKFLSHNLRKTEHSIEPPRKVINSVRDITTEERRVRLRHSLLSRLRKLARKSTSVETSNIHSVPIATGNSNNLNRQENSNATTANNLSIVSDAKTTDSPNENIVEQPNPSGKISIDTRLADVEENVRGTTTITSNENLVTQTWTNVRPVAEISPQEYFRQQLSGVEFPALRSNLNNHQSELVRNVSIPAIPQGRSLSNVSPINKIQTISNQNPVQKLQYNLKNLNISVFSPKQGADHGGELLVEIENDEDEFGEDKLTTVDPYSLTDINSKSTEEEHANLDDSGQYQEINPGQYHEVNPGQYHEVNPGQYHELNPGQYHEINPGQYTEINPGQVELQVDFDEAESIKTYNVHKKTGDYIIGEVGKIDVKNGQTFQGVRYTAVDGILDQEKISEILQHYFGTQTSR